MSNNKTEINADDWAELNLDDTALQDILSEPLAEPNTSRLRDGAQHEGFDNNMGENWIYPNNLPCRSYQMSIVQSALYRNTLVVLPTGLGKTFIAAVVMYNFYRWYPRGKIIFMAPTRPLVNQQIEACKKIMPFPKKDTIELTGKLPRAKRNEMWKTKRVFFATPQVVQSDIFGGRQQEAENVDANSFHVQEEGNKTDFPFDLVKLIIVDEAHKAKGRYAYTEVTHALAKNSKYFRVLALSATPGRTMEDVAEVCRNLLISHIEVRWDTSIDVLPYVHNRKIDTVVVAIGDKIKEIREELLAIVDPYLRQLTEAEVLSGSLTNINRNFLLFEQKRYRDRSFHVGPHPQHSAITSNFAICISLYHAFELLERHGLRVFLNNFEADEDGKKNFVLQMDRRLNDLVENLKTQMGPNPFEFSAAPMTNGKIAKLPTNLDFGHPKFEKTRECLLKHFENNNNSRAIVFCEYRESVMLIYRMLLQHTPLLQPRCFVGQGGTGSLRALTQKQQIQIMNDFRSGKSNILIATSIGEEGIDVGEVELIVCFDISTSNPTRFVQRIGRTGRKKNGHVIMMVTEGREQQLLREVLSNKDQVNKKLLNSSVVQQSLYKYAPRLVPTEFKPKCMQTFVKPPSDDEKEVVSGKSKKIPRNKVNAVKKDSQDLRKFFQKRPKKLDEEDLEFFENNTNMTQARPGIQTQQNIVNKLDKMKNLFKDLQSPIATQTQRVIKNTQTIKEYFKDANAKNKATVSLTESFNKRQTFLEDISATTIDLCDNDDEIGKLHMDIVADKFSPNKIDPERIRKLKEFFKTNFTTTKVLKRAAIKELGYHLKSKEVSREMKTLLLTTKPEYIQENLEQMKVLKAVLDNETTNCTEYEKSIREINSIILDLFGGLEKVERFLDGFELEKYSQICVDSDSELEEQDPKEMANFQTKLNKIFEGYDDGKKHDNFAWIQQRFKETNFYKDSMTMEAHTDVQESAVYERFLEMEDGSCSNNMTEYKITESKYCSQWLEFDNQIIASQSTPLHDAKSPCNRERNLNTLSLLSKFDETTEEDKSNEGNDKTLNASANSKQVQDMLVMLEKQLKESSLSGSKATTPQDDMEKLETIFKAKRNGCEKRKLETESKTLSENNFDDFCLADDDELLFAAAEAELEFSQKQARDKIPTKDNSSPCAKNAFPSANSTPDLDINCGHHSSKLQESPKSPALATALEQSLQQELDIDMEAFFNPFPEEQELIKSSLSNTAAKDDVKKNTAAFRSAIVRESPDLFAEEHIRSPIKKPVVSKSPSLLSTLSGTLNIQKCQSAINAATSATSPHKIFSAQNSNKISPSSRLPTDKNKHEKSPSLFDMYLKNTKGKGKLPRSLTNSLKLTSSVDSKRNVCKPIEDSQQDESLIVIRNRKCLTSKRKIFDSDSEHENDKQQIKGLSTLDSMADKGADSSDFEEVAATQRTNERCSFHQRRKRRRFNSFIRQEAAVSGSDGSEDESENTLNCYAYDSVVVASDDDDPDQASTTHMQAMYLQSLKSPQERRGRFKIPAPRVYNDRSRIFSQVVINPDTYSQYVQDSFVVEETSLINDNAEVSMCPLEKAEKILKERRKAKKMALLKHNRPKNRPKIKQAIIEHSSEDEDFE